MKAFFAPLAIKIFAGVTVLLLVALGIAYLLLASAWSTIEDQRNAIAECNAARAVQNAAIARLGEEGQRQRAAFSRAAQEAREGMANIQPQVRVLRQTARNNCPTPREVMEAGL